MSILLSIFLSVGGTDLASLDAKREDLRPLLNALAVVESNNRDDAVGDSGKAIGRYQIWRVYWKDAVAFAPSLKGEYQNVKDKIYAERIMVAYLLRYAPKAVENKDCETLARIHNGGPRGATKKATEGYWKRVKKVLRETLKFKRPRICYRNSVVSENPLNRGNMAGSTPLSCM